MSHEIKWVWMDARDPAVYNGESHQRSFHARDIYTTPSRAIRAARLWWAEKHGHRDPPTAAAISVHVLHELRPGERLYQPGFVLVLAWPEGT